MWNEEKKRKLGQKEKKGRRSVSTKKKIIEEKEKERKRKKKKEKERKEKKRKEKKRS